MLHRWVLLLLLISALPVSPLFAQQHDHAATVPHIDGSQHPKPDS